MKFDWKNALVTVAVAYVGIKVIEKVIVPMLPASFRSWLE
jgi:hypothetical protein